SLKVTSPKTTWLNRSSEFAPAFSTISLPRRSNSERESFKLTRATLTDICFRFWTPGWSSRKRTLHHRPCFTKTPDWPERRDIDFLVSRCLGRASAELTLILPEGTCNAADRGSANMDSDSSVTAGRLASTRFAFAGSIMQRMTGARTH